MAGTGSPGGGGPGAGGNASLGAFWYRFHILYPQPVRNWARSASSPDPAIATKNDTPLPKALWQIRPLLAAKMQGFMPPQFRFHPGTETSPPDPPSIGTPGRRVTLVIRDPTVDRRVRSHTESIAAILNSLLLRGYIVQTDNDVFELTNREWKEARAPTAFDDQDDGVRVGDFWFDTATGNLYVAKNITPGGAIWAFIGGAGPSGTGLTGTFP